MTKINCPICNQKHELKKISIPSIKLFKKEVIKMDIVHYQCINTGTYYDDENTIIENLNHLEEEYNKKLQNQINNQIPYLVMFKEEEYSQKMNEISEEEFKEHLEDLDFFEKYGNPVKIINEDGTSIVAVSYDLYKEYKIKNGEESEIEEVEKEIELRNKGEI